VHELSIADAVRAIAERHADGRSVTRVEVRIGHLRQVVPASLEFAWDLVTQGTPLDGAELAIEYVPALADCRACGTESELEAFPPLCSACGSLDVEVRGGDELLVDALELEETEEALARSGG
jgi:hydrogenase nickel incorporation protein HypA/HybF